MNNKQGQLVDQVSIGRWAGEQSSSGGGVSIGRSAGRYSQGINGIAVGAFAGSKTQGTCAVAIGQNSGYDSQGAYAIAIGQYAETEDKGPDNQGEGAIAIGKGAGFTKQGVDAIAIGTNAGQGVIKSPQGKYTVTATAVSQTELPNQVDEYNTDAAPIIKHIMVLDTTKDIVAGMKIEETSQIVNTVVDLTTVEVDTAGTQTGKLTFSGFQGNGAIAIGAQASVSAQLPNTIVVNATDTPVHVNKKGSLYIAPVRAVAKNANIVTYDSVTKEMATAFPRMPVYDTDDKATKDLTASKTDKTQNGWMYFDKTKKKIKIWVDSKWLAIADEKDVAASKAAVGGAAGAAMAGATGVVAGSQFGNSQFVTGGGGTSTPQTVIDPVTGESRVAIDGKDFYWHSDDNGATNYPVFYKDINVVSERVPDNANNPNAPGNYVTTYDNGHVQIEPIPTAVWNPPLDAFNNLPDAQRRSIIDGYSAQTGTAFLTWPVSTEQLNANESFGGAPFRNYLQSQGLGK
ncbi:hypothetical protein UFOVP71_289 [uncultured Caudovirales phage]|uniref:Uncharacterized protein n=1 Tax=uncultured Caudovirales phage TaxID=2100421 RepID=A0A6J5TAV2_9CAUD|nr:hypothetical protein UFOVP71_289 [uncultured Caudovirales phage]